MGRDSGEFGRVSYTFGGVLGSSPENRARPDRYLQPPIKASSGDIFGSLRVPVRSPRRELQAPAVGSSIGRHRRWPLPEKITGEDSARALHARTSPSTTRRRVRAREIQVFVEINFIIYIKIF